MQPERGGRARRGGGRQPRRRPVESARGFGEESRNRGGGSRGRGGSPGKQGSRGRGAAAVSLAPQSDKTAAADLESQEEEKEEQGSHYRKRKVVSNWHRYEDTEKETQSDGGESQRGKDFSVLLSSAGDSFTQFRFTEEKEWIAENICPQQLPGFYADCQYLAQAFENLPLHLKLNVPADLVQDATPVTLPTVKPQSNNISKKSGTQLQPLMGQGRVVLSSDFAPDSASHLMLPKRDGFEITSSEAFQKNPFISHHGTDQLDKDLDLLLKLDAPVNYETSSVSEVVADADTFAEGLKVPHEENELEGPEDKSSESEQQPVVSQSITEEELEDWLDSMIS